MVIQSIGNYTVNKREKFSLIKHMIHKWIDFHVSKKIF